MASLSCVMSFMVLVLEVALAHSSEHTTVPRNELAFAVGWTKPHERSVFNVAVDTQLRSATAYELVYYRNWSDHLAIGVHFQYAVHNMDPLRIVLRGRDAFDMALQLDSYNLGPRIRFTLLQGRLSPFGYWGTSFSFGQVEGNGVELKQLDYGGMSVLAGIGLSVAPVAWLDLSGETFFSAGWAQWDRSPFVSSTSTRFNPTVFGIMGNVTAAF